MKTKAAVLFRTVGLSFKIAPFSSGLMIFYYVLEALIPTAIVMVTTSLLNSVLAFSNGEDAQFNKVIFWSVAVFGIYFTQQIFELISNLVINMGVYEKYISYARINLSEKAARLPLIDFENPDVLDKQKRAMECIEYEKLSQLFMSATVCGCALVSVISLSLTLMQFSVFFLPICILSVIPYLIISFLRGKEFYYMKYHQAKKERMLEYLWSLFCEKEAGKEIRVFGCDHYLIEKYEAVKQEVLNEEWHFYKKEVKSLFVCDVIKVTGFVLSIFLSILLAVQGAITVAVFGSCINAFSNVQAKTKEFLTELAFLPDLIRYAADYFDFLNLPEVAVGREKAAVFSDEIQLSEVSFTYPSGKSAALKRINLSIKKGSTVVILGENGSGKSTLSRIIQNLYVPNCGGVTVDKMPLSPESSWHEKISVVNQDFMKLYLTVKENIQISQLDKDLPKPTFDSIMANLKLADPEKTEIAMNTKLGKEYDGIELSGGQWQKLAIARGNFRDSALVILDEPTSALDPLIENDIFTRFMAKDHDQTRIIISHKVGLSKFADQIIVMKEGQIIETGLHQDLINKDGEYKKLYLAQSEWYA